VASGGIVGYFLNDHQLSANHGLRLAADAIQAAGYLGAVSAALLSLTSARRP
jgi:hypothetical protein